MAINEAKMRQVEKQIPDRKQTRYKVDIHLSQDLVLQGFIINQDVARPERAASVLLARYLWENPQLYKEKETLDMRCRSGLQGITMALNGASYVHFSDSTIEAFTDTVENVHTFCPKGKADITMGDLFDKIRGKVDVIVFNHPIFPESLGPDEPVPISMLGPGQLLQRFLQDAGGFLNKAGRIIMPFFHLAGHENDPEIQGPGNGYEVVTLAAVEVTEGLQQGKVSIFELRPK